MKPGQEIGNITQDSLLNISKTGNMMFSEQEEYFLSRYAPMEFFGDYTIRNESALGEAKIMIYDILIKLDISVARGSNLDMLVDDKLPLVNRILGLNLQKSDDALKDIYNIKFTILDYLDSNKQLNENINMRNSVESFTYEKMRLKEIFGNFPIMVYGSSINGKNTDRDTMIFVDDISLEKYRRLPEILKIEWPVPLQAVIMPSKYVDAFVDCDFEHLLSKEKSVFINGSLEFNDINIDRLSNLKMHRMANQIFELRRSLTPKGLEECRILPRINYRLKMPKFISEYLGYCFGMPMEIETKSFKEMPTKDELINNLVKINLAISDHIDYVVDNIREF